ncbi:MAG: F0F1 ATP synthase subunit alpha [Oricola sp.]
MAAKKPDGAPSPVDAAVDDLVGFIGQIDLGPRAVPLGHVTQIADGLAHVSGLPSARFGELLSFDDGSRAFVLGLEADSLQAAMLDPATGIEAGARVRRTHALVDVPVGEGLLGRVIDPLGRPLDEAGPIEAEMREEVEKPAPAIVDRDFVTQPVETGLLVIDALFAIGRGQRELIIGERATGKTSIAVDTIINQKDTDIVCVYVAVGQRATAVRRVIDAIREKGAADRCIFVVAPATAEPGLRWLAPFAGMTIAEYFRDRGGHALVVLDDLTKHAATHRELALLARQPPGREAYPGDIFYLHARLLERAAKLSPERGGGSLTALPIAEIEAGNLSAYIPTNLISIADGQIVLSNQLFAANQRPAVDVGLSVSRVGGKAQTGALKSVAGRVRLDYAQYLELRMFSRFGGFGDEAQKKRIAHGERIGALLAQRRFRPLRPADQVALLAALDDGVLDEVPVGLFDAIKDILPSVIDAEKSLEAFRADPVELDGDVRKALVECVRGAVARAGRAGTGAA